MAAPLLRRLLILASATSCAAGACASWCNRWTCTNTNYCGGCDQSVCRGSNPHPMCSDPIQKHCYAPRCEIFCTENDRCSRMECSGCSRCSGPQPSPFAADEIKEGGDKITPNRKGKPAVQPTCDTSYLTQVKSELQSMVDQQKARNLQLLRAASPDGVLASLPPAAPRIPPLPPSPPTPAPPPCVAPGQQCGGSQWSGPTSCCQASGEPAQSCRWFTDSFSGCRADGP